jgi:hypothetical protein
MFLLRRSRARARLARASSALAAADRSCACSTRGVEFHQQFTGSHGRPGFKSDLFDRAGHFGAEHDTLHRGDRADGAQSRLPAIHA